MLSILRNLSSNRKFTERVESTNIIYYGKIYCKWDLNLIALVVRGAVNCKPVLEINLSLRPCGKSFLDHKFLHSADSLHTAIFIHEIFQGWEICPIKWLSETEVFPSNFIKYKINKYRPNSKSTSNPVAYKS